MSDDYEVKRVFIEEIEFEVYILVINEDEIEDKLAYLAHQRGNIARSFFEDFLLATCVANINQLIGHVKKPFAEPIDLMAVRGKVIEEIYKYNPTFHPDNLVINRNSVVKVKDPDGLKEGERPLTDNKNWSVSYYDELNKAAMDLYDQAHQNEEAPVKPKKPVNQGDIKDIETLDFEVTEQWWDRIRKYINIKKYNEKDAVSLLSKRYFHNRSSFQTFIVSVCVVDFEDLFNTLDDMGIPNRVAPPILMNEIYKLCENINPFLTYENAKQYAPAAEEDEAAETPPGRSRMASTMSGRMNKKKKKKKTFKDVDRKELLNLSERMKVFVIGQDEAVDGLAEAIQRASIGLKDPVRPIGSFLFAGRTGVGKTLTTKVLADELIKERDNMVTIDCSEYSSDHEYSKLIGAPAGYIGHEQGGVLTNAIAKNPFSVVVFDEVEKASSKVHELLLQILEEGRLTDGKGVPVSFRDAIIVMTSNVGVSEIDNINKTIGFGDVAKITDEKKDKALSKALKKKFKPEFLNRLDAVINFKNLNKENYMRIIDIELFKLNDNLKNNDTDYKNLEIEFDDKIRDFIYENGIDENFGARPLKRCIEKEISTPLAHKILSEEVDPNSIVKVSIKRKKIHIDIEEKEEEKSDSLIMSRNMIKED
jgi:ATP-dependent Clp protease ATP-binding subunit ClpC